MTRTASSGRTASRRSMSALINMKPGDAASDGAATNSMRRCTQAGIDVLYDDRDERAGAQVRHRRPDRPALAGRSSGRAASQPARSS